MSRIKFKPYTFSESTSGLKYYDFRPVCSYGTKIIAAIGARRIGKTFGAKCMITKDFLEKGNQFLWLRDNDDSVSELVSWQGEKFFSDYQKKFPSCEFSTKGSIFMCDDEKMGEAGNYMTFYGSKGLAFSPKIKTIVCDELIPEKGQAKREYRARNLVNMLFTVCDTRSDVRIILLSNALDKGDPVLRMFGFNITDYGIYINRDKNIALHYCDNSPEFNKMRSESVMGKFIAGTDFENNLFYNKFDSDDNLLYDTMPKGCTLVCILKGVNGVIRVYLGDDGICYVKEDFNPDTRNDIRYVNDIGLIDSTYRLIPKLYLDAIRRALANSDIRYSDMFSKNCLTEILQKR